MIEINRVRTYTRQHDHSGPSVVRLYNAHLANLGKRNGWARIESDKGVIYRRVRGAGGDSGLARDAMELDYDGRQLLGIYGSADASGYCPCECVITKVGMFGSLYAYWHHPDLEYRVAYRLGLLSFALGIIALGLGILSVVRIVVS